MLTAPITTSHFRDRVFSLCEDLDANGSPVVSALKKEDTDLAPGGLTSQLLAMASPWTDLSSPDPLIYSVSRQVLHLEIAFASFCGVANVTIPGPNLHHGNVHGTGVAQYAHTIQEILEIGIYHQVHVRLSMSDDPATDRLEQLEALSTYARPQFEGQGRGKHKIRSDAFGTWDAWNIVRSICKYNARLFVGKLLPLVAVFSCEDCLAYGNCRTITRLPKPACASSTALQLLVVLSFARALQGLKPRFVANRKFRNVIFVESPAESSADIFVFSARRTKASTSTKCCLPMVLRTFTDPGIQSSYVRRRCQKPASSL